ncbi:hypothetical protein FA95DRAFT_1550265 [Auriscalpium vulgare]|uniref:Uncharacterized protein n=1 Tax=Auriscalpium vulgare TaxID=40419 RepID=A0ACB8R799_9AGAM|nr:hypothetical protein FA95DRAFT_1550265 [Auriscalpium vulgare]
MGSMIGSLRGLCFTEGTTSKHIQPYVWVAATTSHPSPEACVVGTRLTSISLAKALHIKASFSSTTVILLTMAMGDYIQEAEELLAFERGASMIGRATTGFIAHSVGPKMCVWLKDRCRIASDDINKEGNIHRLMQEKDAPEIAVFACTSDVIVNGDIPERTRAQYLHEEDWASETWVFLRAHHRLVLDTIGKKLKEFQSTRQLCLVLRDALLAHNVAFTAAKVLHRDISAKNVLIGADGVGVLIDWDLSKILDANQEVWRQEWRTGTWQFISGRRLENPHKGHEYSDDLESFIHVLVFHLLRYRPTKFEDLEDQFDKLFDDYSRKLDGTVIGGAGKRGFFASTMLAQEEWDRTLSPPCASLVDALRTLFEPLYMARKHISDAKMALTLEHLQNATFMLHLFDDSLNLAPEWEDDGPAEQIAFRLPTREQDRRSLIKRTREESEALLSSKKQRRFKKENGRSGAPSAARTT